MKHLLLPLLLSISSSPLYADETVPAETARIRMFGQNGSSARIYPESSCVKSHWSSDGITVSGGMGQAFSSMIGAASNVSLGMPETPSSKNVHKKNGLLSKAYFQEHAIPAGKPASVVVHYQDVSNFYVAGGITYSTVSASCGGAATFTPEAGADYEVGFSWTGKTCSIAVYRLTIKDDETESTAVPAERAPDC